MPLRVWISVVLRGQADQKGGCAAPRRFDTVIAGGVLHSHRDTHPTQRVRQHFPPRVARAGEEDLRLVRAKAYFDGTIIPMRPSRYPFGPAEKVTLPFGTESSDHNPSIASGLPWLLLNVPWNLPVPGS